MVSGMEERAKSGQLVSSTGQKMEVKTPHLGCSDVFSSQGVVEFSLCLLFAKLVSYTFLYWLPLYIVNVGEDFGDNMMGASPARGASPHLALLPAAHFGAKKAGDLSTLFDVGGILGLSHTRVEGVDWG